VIDARTTGAAATAGVHAHLRRRALPGRRDRPIAGLLLRVWTEFSLSTLLALLGSAFVFGNISLIRVGGSAVLIVVIIRGSDPAPPPTPRSRVARMTKRPTLTGDGQERLLIQGASP